jgi:hypothetical protein
VKEITEGDLLELPFTKAQYLLSMGAFLKRKNLRFEDHTHLFHSLATGKEFGKKYGNLDVGTVPCPLTGMVF